VLPTWAVSDPPAGAIAETKDANEAIAAVVANLPEDRRVWLGSDPR